jgi:hypothetical protein
MSFTRFMCARPQAPQRQPDRTGVHPGSRWTSSAEKVWPQRPHVRGRFGLAWTTPFTAP